MLFTTDREQAERLRKEFLATVLSKRICCGSSEASRTWRTMSAITL